MARLLIVLAVGIALGVAASLLVTNALSGVANGTPSNAALYQYGTR